MFMFQAHTAGTGKSYMANLISNLVRGRSCPVITVSNSEEMEKRLGSLILQSVPMFSLDNCTENVGGSVLCQLVEQPLIGIRVLGKSQLIECEWRGVVFATGNNVSVVGDMARRTLICTLDANVERPEMRRFKFNPVEQVLENRGEYVAAALTIARAYFYEEEKHKIKCESIASYDEWSRAVREPLIWLGEADPVVGMNKARDEDPERNMALILAQEWVKHMQPLTKPRKAEEIARIASERDANGNDLEWQPKRPELYELLLERCGMPNGRGIEVRRLGRWLRQLRGQVHGGFRFNLFGGDTHRGHNWMLQPIDFG
jgi:putative DNA primase/helicase